MNFLEQLDAHRKVVDEHLDTLVSHRLAVSGSDYTSKQNSWITEMLSEGGKRLRPILVMESYRLVSGTMSEEIIRASLALEILHNSTLVHDDFMDGDWIRRGKPNINARLREHFLSTFKDGPYDGELFKSQMAHYVVTQATIIGNRMRDIAFDALRGRRFNSHLLNESIGILTNAEDIVNQGQALDDYFGRFANITEQNYLEIIEKKTAHLFSAAADIGAELAGATESQRAILRNFAKKMGVAFQIYDDLMDINKESGKGNTYGSDIRNGKKTILIVKAYENAFDNDKKTLDSIVGRHDATEQEIDTVAKIMQESGAIEYARGLSSKYVDSAKVTLTIGLSERFPVRDSDFLLSFADYMIGRKR